MTTSNAEQLKPFLMTIAERKARFVTLPGPFALALRLQNGLISQDEYERGLEAYNEAQGKLWETMTHE